MKWLGVNLTDQRQSRQTEWELKEDMVDLSVSQSRAQVSQRRGDDASWWKWCKSPSPAGNTELMWVTSAKTSKRQREKGHLEDRTLQTLRVQQHRNIFLYLRNYLKKAHYVKFFTSLREGREIERLMHIFMLCFSWSYNKHNNYSRLTLLTTVKTV